MHRLYDTFIFRLLVPESAMPRPEIEQRLFHGPQPRFTQDDVKIVGSVNQQTLLITEDEEKTLEIMLLIGAKLERINRKEIKGLTSEPHASK